MKTVTFLSAQPDDYYFVWQLALQLYNFNNLGIAREHIHVLIAYDPKRGLQQHFREFINENGHRACFFTYADNRAPGKYLSTIRPHIIRQHLLAHPRLQHEAIFYHDSDIIFRALPHFNNMLNDATWYVSDTRDYLDSQYIIRTGGTELFKEMCNATGIDPETIVKQDAHAGGAQYLLKNTTPEFWEKVERDCATLFGLMQNTNDKHATFAYLQNNIKRSAHHGIQAWCADMWALLWNALLFGNNVQIHPELNFCWPDEPIDKWYACNILHYSGKMPKEELSVFCKSNYSKCSPFYDLRLKLISEQNCSSPLVNLIKQYRAELDINRIDLSDVTFIITVRLDSRSRGENLYMIINYLNKYFKTNILVAEADVSPRVDASVFPPGCTHVFTKDDATLLHRTRLNNACIQQVTTPLVTIYDTDVVLPIQQITDSVQLLRLNNADMVSPYNGSFVSVDNLLKIMFGRILDPALFTANLEKLVPVTHRSYGGAIFFNRQKYMTAGMDNEYLTSWGPEDIERVKRMKNLGFTVKRIAGPLFHLPHTRNENSGYAGIDTRVRFMDEYLKVCNMPTAALKEYVATWPWATAINHS